MIREYLAVPDLLGNLNSTMVSTRQIFSRDTRLAWAWLVHILLKNSVLRMYYNYYYVHFIMFDCTSYNVRNMMHIWLTVRFNTYLLVSGNSKEIREAKVCSTAWFSPCRKWKNFSTPLTPLQVNDFLLSLTFNHPYWIS